MKYELNRPTDYSDEAFLNEIRRVSKIVDKPLTIPKFENKSKYSASTINKRFGGWLAALNKAGLDESFLHTDNLKISREEIISELKRVSLLLKSKSFSLKEFVENSTMSKYVFRGQHSFNKLMKLAGLEIPIKSRKYTYDECFENLLNVWSHYGRQPNYSEMKQSPSIVGPKAYIVRWGTWRKALLAFLERVNSDITETSDIDTKKEIEDPPKGMNRKLSIEERREIPLGLRFKILQRDRYRCVLCGRSPSMALDIILHVDHIIPFSKGGKTREDNLRTLCYGCNIGKGDKLD